MFGLQVVSNLRRVHPKATGRVAVPELPSDYFNSMSWVVEPFKSSQGLGRLVRFRTLDQ